MTTQQGTTTPRFPLAALADELRDEHTRLDALDAGDPASSIQAVFSWPYQRLSGPAARMFRLLSLLPAPTSPLTPPLSSPGCPK